MWQYVKLGALPVVVKGFVKCLVKGRSFKGIYPEVLRRIEPILVEKYSPISRGKRKGGRVEIIEHEHPKVIWWCWLQGLEQTPEIVTACYHSLKRNFPEYEIRVIDAKNWNGYIELPNYIVKKWEKKQIPPALFSDLLRLQLLIGYGGSWIDSTVFCTGIEHTREYLDADLFLFQYTPEGATDGIRISNWFISTHSNNEVLIVLRDMLFAYWKDFDCTLDYYIFHLFFSVVAKKYPQEIAAMPYGYSMNSLSLLHHWGEKFDIKKWDKLTSRVSIHKLAFRVNDTVKNDKENYYNYLLSEYGSI